MMCRDKNAGLEARVSSLQGNPAYQITLDSSEKNAYLLRLDAAKKQVADEIAFIKPDMTDPDRYQLEYIIWELGVNAAEHGNKYRKNSKVTIKLYDKDGRISLVIKDQGKGFDAAGLYLPIETRETFLAESARDTEPDDVGSYDLPAAAQMDYSLLETRGRGVSILSLCEIVENYCVKEGKGEVRVDLKIG